MNTEFEKLVFHLIQVCTDAKEDKLVRGFTYLYISVKEKDLKEIARHVSVISDKLSRKDDAELLSSYLLLLSMLVGELT